MVFIRTLKELNYFKKFYRNFTTKNYSLLQNYVLIHLFSEAYPMAQKEPELKNRLRLQIKLLISYAIFNQD
jgi:hypothetical protein